MHSTTLAHLASSNVAPRPRRYAIGIGGNLGDVPRNFASALQGLDATCGTVTAVSRFYRTEPLTLSSPHDASHLGRSTLGARTSSIDFPDEVASQPTPPRYLNGAFILASSLEPHDLLTRLHSIERRCGRYRERESRWESRTLDLDILLCDDLILNDETLIIPHPGLTQRLFVLVPLSDIAASWIHPSEDLSVSQLLQRKLNEPLTLGYPELLLDKELGPLRSWQRRLQSTGDYGSAHP